MATVLIQHQVKDYDAWKEVFDSAIDLRKSNGELSAQVYRSNEDGNNVTALFTWDSIENARSYVESAELKEAMQFAQSGFFKVKDSFIQARGWGRHSRGELIIIDKNGATATHSTWIGMIPDLEIGIFFLGNKNVKEMTKVGRDLLDIIALEHTAEDTSQ